MFRRAAQRSPFAAHLCAFRQLTVDADTRQTLSKHLAALKEECKGQGLDLADMSDAAKAATRSFQDSVKKSAVEDAQFKGKIVTLSASMKAYNTRLSNLQSESRSIQTEVDALLKLLWGTEQPQAASFSTPPPEPPKDKPAEDFGVEPPPVSTILEGEQAKPEPAIEHVDGERVEQDKQRQAARQQRSEDLEVETIEVEVEPVEAAAESPADTAKITDITSELYERGVDFSDCLDARSLRQRYKDVLSGKVPSGYPNQQAAQRSYSEPLQPNTNQPRMPQRPQQQYQSPPPPPNSGSSVTADPYPNAQRKMVDPMRYVREIKAELAAEKSIDPNSVDLWSGKVKLEDHKRLYDYPSIQSYPIEVRQKGDIPQ